VAAETVTWTRAGTGGGPGHVAGRRRVGEGESEQGVGAAGIHGTGIVGGRAAGEPVEAGVEGGGAVGGQQRPQPGHPVGERADGDPPVGDRPLVADLGGGRVGSEDCPAQAGAQLAGGLPTGAWQHPLLHGGGQRVVQGGHRLDDHAGLWHVDAAGAQRGGRGRQPSGQLDGELHQHAGGRADQP